MNHNVEMTWEDINKYYPGVIEAMEHAEMYEELYNLKTSGPITITNNHK